MVTRRIKIILVIILLELVVILGIALELFCRVKLAVEDIEAEESALLEDLYAADRKFSEYYNVWKSPSGFTPLSWNLNSYGAALGLSLGFMLFK